MDEPEAISALLEQRGFRAAARKHWGEKEWRLHRWVYHRLTERVDAQVGGVLDALEISGQADDTVVVFTSDHGDHDSSHKLEHKTVLYDEASRVPLIVRDPALPPRFRGTKTECGLVQTGIDLMATVCDYAGVEQPAHCAGMSLRPTASGSSRIAPRDGVYSESEIGYMYVTDRYKFVRYDEGTSARQLYDLERDPGETRNWIDDPGMDVVAADLERALETEFRKHRLLAVSNT